MLRTHCASDLKPETVDRNLLSVSQADQWSMEAWFPF